MIVYLITNKIDGKQYIGQTTQELRRRWAFHVCKRSGCTYLKNAIEKYGKENFKIEEIYKAQSLEELDRKEQEFIIKFNTLAPNGYNLTSGGERPVFSEEVKDKISRSSKGKTPWNKGLIKEDDRVKSYIRSGESHHYFGLGPWLGKKHSPESVEKMSKSKIGHVHSEETKDKISKANSIPKPEGFSETMRLVQSKRAINVICVETNTEYESISVASKAMGLNPGHIHRNINGKLKTVKGFTFKVRRNA